MKDALREPRRGTLALSWGPWGGFYIYNGYCWRLSLGWVALTYLPVEIDDLMAAMKDDGPRNPRNPRYLS